jgi:hypothetical protein
MISFFFNITPVKESISYLKNNLSFAASKVQTIVFLYIFFEIL